MIPVETRTWCGTWDGKECIIAISKNLSAEEESSWLRRYGWGSWYFSQTELRDERAVLFASYLPRGTYEYLYYIRASVPGEYLVIPTTAYEMYWPDVFGRSDGARFTVESAD